ncbi:phosphotransferase enzyme family protein [Alteribacillus sp. JSM 102045]|uniref:phosphotransferase enzyme family protein n=1 Tax=Alteribacillus sp. JSM 102045 TaxID=1562101 RepID=UPI0035BF3B7A
MRVEWQRFIKESYGLESNAAFSLLHAGENRTYVVHTPNQKLVIRHYRNRFSLREIHGEISWMNAMLKFINVPEVLPNKNGSLVTSFRLDENTNHYFVTFQYIDGSEISQPDGSNYETLGEIMSRLHEGSEQVLKNSSTDWPGYQRPYYRQKEVLAQSLQQLTKASFLSKTEKEFAVTIADRLDRFMKKVKLGPTLFVHGDVHFGNILEMDNQWYLLDFDECGFSCKEFDIGVPRIHLIASGKSKVWWPFLKRGYREDGLHENNVRAGTALRLFYMAGKIPLRLDMKPIQSRPNEFINRYLRFIKEELEGEIIY